MSQGRRIAAVLALTAVATVVEAASAPAVQVPGVTTPSASTPAVTVPPVKTPVITTPSVNVPPATAPKVTTPSVSTPPAGGAPKVTAPKVTPPKVSTPSVTAPSVSAPKSTQPKGGGSPGPKTIVPSVTIGGDGGGGIVNTVRPTVGGTVGGLAGRTTNGAAVRAQGVAGGYTTGTTGNPAVTPVFGGMPGSPGGGGLAGPGGSAGLFGPGFGLGSPLFALDTATLGDGSGGVTAFAAAVGALAGCFYALTPIEQQILTVRTGIDGRQPLTRPQVAALFGTSSTAIARTERGALGRLREAADTDGCMPVALVGPANAVTAFIGGPFGPLGFVTPGVAPVSRSEPVAGGERFASTSIADRLAGLPDSNGQASLSILMVIAVMLSGALAALLFEARRQVH
jgi:hypothetical protein